MKTRRLTDDLHVYDRIPVDVPGSPHEVIVGRGLIGNCWDLVGALAGAESLFVLTHPELGDVAAALQGGLGERDVPVHLVLVDEGEPSKSLAGVARIYEELAGRGAHRHDVVVAIGGGVITDVGGFVASTFNRGMPLVNVPTTLLGQVDAAIGGKNGINLEHGKNLVGTIYQPTAVLCDVDLLMTLPRVELSSGLAEVVKYGFIADPRALDMVQNHIGKIFGHHDQMLGDIVARCARVKAAVVAEDERESGVRAHLNYGHTFAHAIERTAGYGDIRHGEAVAIGMMAAAHLAHEMERIGPDVVERHRAVLEACVLPVTADLELRDLEAAWLHDKKYERGVRFVLLKRDGAGRVVPEAGVEAPREAIERALRRLAQ